MPNIASVLKDEITRLCRKEIRAQIGPVKSASTNFRHEIAELKRRLAQLERQSTKLARQVPKTADEPEGEDRKLRFVPKGLPSQRKRLGVSIEEFASLVGVSAQTIYNWQSGKSVPRRAQLEKLASIRAIGKREAREILDSGA